MIVRWVLRHRPSGFVLFMVTRKLPKNGDAWELLTLAVAVLRDSQITAREVTLWETYRNLLGVR